MTARFMDDSSRDLADLLDQLVAIDLELEGVCHRKDGDGREANVLARSISDACEILRGSIVDLRAILLRLDGLPYVSGETGAPEKHS